jgi:hypothetical protein
VLQHRSKAVMAALLMCKLSNSRARSCSAGVAADAGVQAPCFRLLITDLV